MAKSKGPEKNFETSLSTLERIVGQLESGDLPLENALELFEEGVGLARQCQTQLQEAERKVEMLLRERGEIKVVPFETVGETKVSERVISDSQPSPTSGHPESLNKDEEDEDEDTLDDTIPF